MQLEQIFKNNSNRLTTKICDDIIYRVNRMLMLLEGGKYLNG